MATTPQLQTFHLEGPNMFFNQNGQVWSSGGVGSLYVLDMTQLSKHSDFWGQLTNSDWFVLRDNLPVEVFDELMMAE